MAIVYRVTPELRAKLKKPFGILIQGSFEETMQTLGNIVEREKPSKIVSVGDIVSRNLHANQINPQLSITDNKSMRKRVKQQVFTNKRLVHVKNPRGAITEEAIEAVKESMKSDDHVHILVDGEEDLLALVAIIYAPEEALVIYGQPNEGIVVVETSSEKKTEATKTLKAMKTVRKAK